MERKITLHDGKSRHVIYCKNGANLYFALFGKEVQAANAPITIHAFCGGKGTCKKCLVRIENECANDDICRTLLSNSQYEQGYRLACFYNVERDIVVHIQSEEIFIDTIKTDDGAVNFESDVFFDLAIDIGTTTIAMAFILNGTVYDTKSFINPQISYGADVITRICKCDEYLLDMQRLVVDAINNSIANRLVRNVFISANTIMLHIIAGISPKSIGQTPYLPQFIEQMTVNVGIKAGKTILLPTLSGFIGADILSGVMIAKMRENSLMIDLGTNGEIAIFKNGRYYFTSAALGPAFEGGHISCGGYASEFTVNACSIEDGQIAFDNKNACKISGSGIIDLLACLVELRAIDESGRIFPENRYYDGKNLKIFNITLTGQDIRELQLAKSAIHSAVSCLLLRADISFEKIEAVYLTGGFSRSLNVKNAYKIKMLPNFDTEIVQIIKNASLSAAIEIAKGKRHICEIELIKQNSVVIDLNEDPKFFEFYIENMLFWE